MTELLFTEDEWNTAMPKVVADMTAYLRPYRAPIYEHHAATEDDEEHGTGWGSGSYLRLGDKVLILTNEHVSCVRRQNRVQRRLVARAARAAQAKTYQPRMMVWSRSGPTATIEIFTPVISSRCSTYF